MLTLKQKKQLKAQAHKLKPVIMIGSNGLTDAVLAEADRALLDHELIKARILGFERGDRAQIRDSLCEKLAAECIQTLGRIVVLYRKKPD